MTLPAGMRRSGRLSWECVRVSVGLRAPATVAEIPIGCPGKWGAAGRFLVPP